MNWNQKLSNGLMLSEYLKQSYSSKSDNDIALYLSKATGETITRNAVRKARQRYGLLKDNNSTPANVTASEIEITGNYATATCEASSLEELTNKLKIDTSIWQVKSFKTWQGFAKVDGELTTIPLLSAEFVKRNPERIIPTVTPVLCNTSYPDYKPKLSYDTQSELVFSDLHFGFRRINASDLEEFHDWKALQIILEYAKLAQPDTVRILGDILDLPDFSDKFLRTPDFINLTQKAIEACYSFLKLLRNTLPTARIILMTGNHDKRLEDMIARHLPYAYGLKAADEVDLPSQLSIQRLLALHQLKIHYTDSYPNDYSVSDNGLVEYQHGESYSSKSGQTAKTIISDSDITKVFGHIHRIESASKTIWRGNQYRIIQAHSFGCTCKIDGSVPGQSKRQNWQQGFGVVHLTDSDYSITPYRISNSKSITEYGIISV